MFGRFSGNERKIVAGINLGPGDDQFIQSAVSLAKRTGMRLHFVHAVEPWSHMGAAYPSEYLSVKLAKLSEEKRLREADYELKQKIAGLSKEAEISYKVLPGSPADMIRSEALSSRASLVLCGVKQVSHRLIPRGFSTACQLTAESPIPVMAIPEGLFSDFESGRFKVLVADDLTQASVEAMPTAAELTGAFKNSQILHLHVHPATQEELTNWANEISELMIAHDLGEDISPKTRSIIADTQASMLEKLRNRIEIPVSFLEQNDISYEPRVAFGNTIDQLKAVVEKEEPSLVAFGRHHFLHKHPFSIGKVPFYAMLNLGVPILVVSNIARLN